SAQRHASTSTRALQTWLRCAFTSAPDCVVGSIPANSILQIRLSKSVRRDSRMLFRHVQAVVSYKIRFRVQKDAGPMEDGQNVLE
ncbi:hypothetical protein, partial [Candidatus Burkholderia verschuerenii]|uniref:hypothetical protein n=1 Tax=Candidatus Burkholderia verschuerenii TaxID=242163 RepID=UPI001E2CC44E